MDKQTRKKNINDGVIEVIDRLSRCAKRYGFPAIMDKLNELEVDDKETNNIFNYIFEVVEVKFNVSRRDILGTKRGVASEARKICLMLIYHHTELSAQKIADIFDNRSKQAFFKVKKEFENISKNPATEYNRKFISSYKELEIKVDVCKQRIQKSNN